MILLEMIFFCECSCEGWRSPIALTFEPITKIWRAHILQSKPFNISIDEICKTFNFFLDLIRSFRPWKLLIKKKEKEIFLLNENDVQWTLSTLPWTRPGRSLEESPVVQRWHCCDENQIVFILNVADEGLLKWFLCSPYIRSQQACHRALWCDLPETKDNILG